MFEVNAWSGVCLAPTYMKGTPERRHGRIILISNPIDADGLEGAS